MKTNFLFLLFSFIILNQGVSQGNPTPEEIRKILEEKGFVGTPITIVEVDTINCNDATAIRKFLEENGFDGLPTKIVGASAFIADSSLVQDFAKLSIEMDGMKMNMAQALERDILTCASEGVSCKAIVTKNENFCDEQVKAVIFNDFDREKFGASINAHIWKNPNSEEDLLFMRFNLVDFGQGRD